MRIPLALCSIASLAACQQPAANRITDRLTVAGVPPTMARCMADIWAERLNVAQLGRLASAADQLSQAGGDVQAIGSLLERSRALQDPELVDVVTASAARCAFSL